MANSRVIESSAGALKAQKGCDFRLQVMQYFQFLYLNEQLSLEV